MCDPEKSLRFAGVRNRTGTDCAIHSTASSARSRVSNESRNAAIVGRASTFTVRRVSTPSTPSLRARSASVSGS